MSNPHSDEPKLLPGCWLESPWDPGTAGTISEQSHLIDLIPLYKAQWLRYFLFWAILVGGTLALGALVPPMLNAMNIPVPDLIKLGKTGLDRWLETVLLLLTAGTSYLAWRIRKQKPECLTRGWILFFCVGLFLYMSLDRTSHCAQSLTNSINTILHDSLENNSVSLGPDNILYWETAVYGIIYLAVLSRLMIEFSGASMAQLFLLAATAAYACSCGLWFAPESLKLPLTIEELSGALTLAGDFFLFWSLINYARFILLDGFGLDSEGWRIAINRYRYRSRYSSRRNSYMQAEAESNNDYSSHSAESSTDTDAYSRESSPFAANESGTQSQTVTSNPASPYSQTISSVATTGIPTPETSYNPQTAAAYEQTYNSPYTQQTYGQQAYPQQPYSQAPYGQPQYGQPQQGGQTPYNSQVPYSQTPYVQPQYNQTSYDIPQNQGYGQNTYPPPPQPPQTTSSSTASNSSPSGQTSSTSTTPTAQEVQREFKKLEEKIHRQLTYDEKKAVVRRMIRERQGK